MQKRRHETRYPSSLCISCINYGGDATTAVCRAGKCCAGVKRLTNRFECESYVRLFEKVPFLVEHENRGSNLPQPPLLAVVPRALVERRRQSRADHRLGIQVRERRV